MSQWGLKTKKNERANHLSVTKENQYTESSTKQKGCSTWSMSTRTDHLKKLCWNKNNAMVHRLTYIVVV